MISTKKFLFYITLILLITVFLSIENGAAEASFLNLFVLDDNNLNNYVLLNIRLPRLVMGLIVGAALSICGASMQGLFRNPLADPGLIGITSGATLAVGVLIVLFPSFLVGIFGLYALSLAAFFGAMITSVIFISVFIVLTPYASKPYNANAYAYTDA